MHRIKMKYFCLGVAFVLSLAALVGAGEAGYSIPDFKCGTDGQMLSGFHNGKPVCSTPAGFIMPNLKCPESYKPQVLVGIHDGQPMCKGIAIYGDQNLSVNSFTSAGEDININLHYMPSPPSVQLTTPPQQ